MIIRKFNNISNVIYDRLTPDHYTVTDEGDQYDAALVRSYNMHEEPLPESLLAIGRAGIGVDNIPVEKCSEQGIVVFNAPGANANAVKELVLCSMLLSGRQIIKGAEWIEEQNKAGKGAEVKTAMEKAKKQFVGHEILGKTLGVIGLGAIGGKVANAAAALGMNVVGYDPYISIEAAHQLSADVKIVNKRENVFKNADFVTLHIHLTDETKNTVNYKEIEMMNDGAVVLNFARGGLVNDDAIIDNLASGKLSRYMTDFPDERLIACENVIALPHLGGSTPEAEENCAAIASKELDNYLRFGKIKNSVNLPNFEGYFDGGFRICVINRNISNMIGQITDILAKTGANIENMTNRSKGEWAYTVIDLKEEPSEETLKAIENIDGVVRVRLIHWKINS